MALHRLTDSPAIASCIGIISVILLIGCAQTFPKPTPEIDAGTSQLANEIFASTLIAHGSDQLDQFKDLSVGLNGEWKFLITRIQPLVTDHKYRVISQERILPGQGVYAAFYEGPAGSKYVYRDRSSVRVYYDGVESTDADVLRATALTADSFYLFLLGPLALTRCLDNLIKLGDIQEKNRKYYRLHCTLKPGFGFSERDEVVIWVDANTRLTYRVHITLEGYRTTKGAHVDVTFTDYTNVGGYTLPSVFEERVLGPIRIHAHDWYLTGVDINRGFSIKDLNNNKFRGAAHRKANPLLRNGSEAYGK